jgi:hypothetical protein
MISLYAGSTGLFNQVVFNRKNFVQIFSRRGAKHTKDGDRLACYASASGSAGNIFFL